MRIGFFQPGNQGNRHVRQGKSMWLGLSRSGVYPGCLLPGFFRVAYFLRSTYFLFCLILAATQALADDAQHRQQVALFEREIRPVLIDQCVQCHGVSKQEGGLRLDTQDAILTGGDSGPAIVVGSLKGSMLIEALRHQSLEMPPTGRLADNTISHFEWWIDGGAVWPESNLPLRSTGTNITETDRKWWAFQPLVRVEPPIDPKDRWSRTPIDRFIWKELAGHKLQPAPPASKEVLVRRLYFNLIGLPPSPDEMEAFVLDESPSAVGELVNRLLDDPRYGEHWARFWLDLVRYSESDGWNQDAYRPQLWRYRDYVISAFNQDLPYPRFVLDQLAGDEVLDSDPSSLVASGFLRLGVYEYNQRDARGQWNEIMNEMTDVAGDVFMGLSMACARCHDHKFDPIPQRDYFKLRAFFEPLIWRDDLVAATEAEKKTHQESLAEWQEATKVIRQEIARLLEPYEVSKWKSTVDKFPLDIQACFHMPREDRTSWQDQMAYLVARQYTEEGGGPLKNMRQEDSHRHAELLKELAAFDHLKPTALPEVMAVSDFSGLVSPTVNPEDPRRQPIPPGFLEVSSELELPRATSVAVRVGSTGRRTALANWITDPRNALTARVIVNRIWQQHFGLGIAATSSDFGRLGSAPTHPELLDWVTAYFIDHGWSLKRLHQLILMSAVWQQSASHPEASAYQERDPAERLLWRARVRRLTAEQIRDAMLVATGELSAEIGGPSVAEDAPRRSIYLKSYRNASDTFLHGFDAAKGLQSVSQRDSTTTPVQSLLLLNGDYALKRSDRLASRLLAENLDPTQTIEVAFRSVWGVDCRQQELDRAFAFLNLHSGETSQDLDAVRFADFCHVLFNSNQFLYLE